MRKKLRVGDRELFWLGIWCGVLDFGFQIYFRLINLGYSNSGVSFGWGEGSRGVLFLGLGGLLIFYWWFRSHNVGLFWVLVGGSVNVLQRLIWGSVWDYLNWSWLGFWNNGADILIFVGVILYLLTYERNRDKNTI